MSNDTIKERVERYREAQGHRGLVLVKVWVPKPSRDLLRDYAQRLRTIAGRPEPKRRKGRKT